MSVACLLAGPDPDTGTEAAGGHLARLGPLPVGGGGLIETLERSGLRGRGGAAFPVAAKWRAVAQRASGTAVVLVNGAEGEPLSRKDRVLMELRPHLILDGAALAAHSVGADEIAVYVGAEHGRAAASLQRAVAERSGEQRRRIRLVRAPATYVAGEESAAVHYLNDGVALPTATPPRPYQRGVGGRPTLVQNVETLAHVALIARYGDGWYQASGRDASAGTALITLSGAVPNAGVVEVAQGTTIGEVLGAGGDAAGGQAVLLGGYFGSWVAAEEASALALDPVSLRARRHSLGCGVVAVLPHHRCGVVETARCMSYLAGSSARQCGPCVFGLRAIAAAAERLAATTSDPDDLAGLQRWSHQVVGRGACAHPNGAATLMLSALQVFDHEFALHHEHRRCSVSSAVARAT